MRLWSIVASLFWVAALPATRSQAICDIFPGPTAAYRGALGTLNRPFAIPGDVGQQVAITLDPSECDAASPGLLNLGGGIGEDDYFVTILFEPPSAAAPRHAVVLTTAVNAADCGTKLAAALPLLGAGGAASCETVVAQTQQLAIPNPTTLELRFPDTDALVGSGSDDRTLSGPATIAVTPITDPLPFGLASARCADTPGLVACIDELYADDGTCDNAASNTDPGFGSFTALPPANDYRALCNTPGTECTGLAPELRFAVDAAGNALIPIDWRGVLLRPDGIPVPRVVRGTTEVAAFAAIPLAPIRIPSRSFLTSHAPSGRRVPPLFEPLTDPNVPTDLVLFGSVDAPIGVMRIARRLTNDAGVHQQCSGGDHADLACVAGEDCPGGSCGPTVCHTSANAPTTTRCTRDAQCAAGQMCGPALFDFSDRLDAGVGPVLVAQSAYDLDAQNPVPLEGLLETDSLFAFVELEAIAGSSGTGPVPQDLNADGDTTDAVLVLRDRVTGLTTPIGSTTGDGRAAVRIHDPPFSSPAIAVEGDVAAFLESEPLEGNTDANANGNVFDSILRVYRMDPSNPAAPEANPLLTSNLAVDADPIVGGKSLALASGWLYFRASEAQNTAQITDRVTSGPETLPPHDTGSRYATLSGDGRYVNFTADAAMPMSASIPPEGADTNSQPDVYSLDRDSDGDGVYDDPSSAYTRLSVRTDGHQGEPVPGEPAPGDLRCYGGYPGTPDGRYVGFGCAAHLDTSVAPIEGNPASSPGNEWIPQYDAYVRDRDVSGDGTFDDPNDVATVVVGRSTTGLEGNHSSGPADMTPDARFVVLNGRASNLVQSGPTGPDDPSDDEDVFVRDLQANTTSRINLGMDGSGGSCVELLGVDGAGGSGGSITDDGRYIAFVTRAHAVPGDTDSETDVYIRDRDVDRDGVFDECGEANARTTLVNVAPPDESPNVKDTSNPALSPDGASIVFWSESTNLVEGDTNSAGDVFRKDLTSGAVSRISVSSSGQQSNGSSGSPYIARSARYVAFPSSATNLSTGGPDTTVVDVFLHDLVTGHTVRVSEAAGSAQPNDASYPSGIDERFVAFASRATNLVGVDNNLSQFDVFVRGPDTTDLAKDYSGDDRLDDTVLFALDTTAPAPVPVVLGPAREASVAPDGAIAFLRPEERNGFPGIADSFPCNADGDFDDACVFLSLGGGAPADLGREATAVGISDTLVAALVPGAGGRFLQVWGRPAGPWSANLGPAADSLEVSGDTVSFRAAGSGTLYVYDHTDASVTSTGAPAEDFVAGEEIVAFRSAESVVGADLNDDGDTNDDVMRVWDVASQQVVETAQAVTPCRFEVCRPRRPYRVFRGLVTFLTLEADQGNADLDGNGDNAGLVIQSFNVRKFLAALLGGGGGGFAPPSFARASFAAPEGGGFEPLSGGDPEVTTLAGVSAGVCTTTGDACSTDADCGGGSQCFLPPGGCIQDLGTACNVSTGCPANQFCVPTPGQNGAGLCHTNHGPCGSDANCSGFPGYPATTQCEDGDRDRVRLAAAIADDAETGAQVAPVLETAEGICGTDAECEPDEFCNPNGLCQPDAPEIVTAGAPDTDGDGVDDVHDSCPRRANAEQTDTDGDGAGDACDLETCGDGVQTYAEECDGGNADPGDGCDATCRLEVGATAACQNGIDDDGDGQIDLADVGCASAADTSERRADIACDDGVDNDGDGGIDLAVAVGAADDPGCTDETGTREDPKCQNGLDDDGQPGIDFDGGASLGLTNPADPQCTVASKNKEAPTGCGAGAELVVLLAALTRARGRRESAGARS